MTDQLQPTDDLRTRIAAVQQAHRWGVFRCGDGYARTCCRCQWRETPDGPTHAEHVADALIEALDLERENWNVDMGVSTLPRHMWVKPTPIHRYVTSREPSD